MDEKAKQRRIVAKNLLLAMHIAREKGVVWCNCFEDNGSIWHTFKGEIEDNVSEVFYLRDDERIGEREITITCGQCGFPNPASTTGGECQKCGREFYD